jgi:hypothetical protein
VKFSVLMVLSFLFLAACSSSPIKEKKYSPAPKVEVEKYTQQKPERSDSEPQIDEASLQSWLGLQRSFEDLGYSEKSFNTCDVGFGYSKSNECQKKHMVIIHYRLQCRDSEGTVQRALTSADLRNIASEEVRWTLPGKNGTSRTDGEGYGQIRGIFSASQKNQRLKLGVGNDYLYMRANEITQVVTPGSWCQ